MGGSFGWRVWVREEVEGDEARKRITVMIIVI